MESLLVTGFGPFGSIDANPSQKLAETCGEEFRVLEVSFRAVDLFVEELALLPPRPVLLMGVAAASEKMRIEWVARNRIGKTPDVLGQVQGPSAIDPNGPPNLAASLWQHSDFGVEHDRWLPSVDAGDYLCNYVFYRALQKGPHHRIGFLHVPSEAKMGFADQALALQAILQNVKAAY